MAWKKFLKPTLSKILLTPLLLYVASIVESRMFPPMLGGSSTGGWPFDFWVSPPFRPGLPTESAHWIWGNLAIDLLFWYLITCIIIYLFKIIRRRYRSS